mmetsp:Transcript_11520/g.24280  ORF Transcript_11520/g.24280 Transcript_11520/m.24280 type:complete len:635 (-) Transcript_11520:274-2178(-)
MASLGSGNSHNTGGGGGARNFFGSFSSASNNSSTNDNKHHHRGTQKGTIKDKDKDKDSDNEAAAAATTTPIHAASSSIASLPPSDHPRSSLQRSRSERRRRRAATSSSSTSAHFASFTSAAAATSSSSRHAAGVSSGARDHRDPRGSAPRSSLRRHRHPNDRNRVGTSLRFRQVDLDWTPDDDDDDDDDGHRVVDRRGEVEVVSSRTFSWPGRAGRDFHGGLLGGGEGGGGGVAVPDDADARYDDNNNNDNDDDTDGDGTGMDIEVMDLRPAAHPSAMMMAVTSSFVSMSSRVSIESDDLNGLFRVAIATDDRHDDDGNGNGNGIGNGSSKSSSSSPKKKHSRGSAAIAPSPQEPSPSSSRNLSGGGIASARDADQDVGPWTTPVPLGVYRINFGSGLPLRETPERDSPLLGMLERGQFAEVVETTVKNDRVRARCISTDGGTTNATGKSSVSSGWISLLNVKTGSSGATCVPLGAYVTVSEHGCVVTEGAAESSKLKRTLTRGTCVEVCATRLEESNVVRGLLTSGGYATLISGTGKGSGGGGSSKRDLSSESYLMPVPLGTYHILYEVGLPVTSGIDGRSDVVTKLAMNTRVEVVETSVENGRVRGRICHPSHGWISLFEPSCRWAKFVFSQ